MIKVTKKSPVSRVYNSLTLDITSDQLYRWSNGELIQDVMPNLSEEEREFLITGMTPEEQDKMYNALKEEEE